MRTLGKPENARFVQVGLFQGSGKKMNAPSDIESAVSDNPLLQNLTVDPTVFCSAFKKNRFYLFTRREPDDTKRYIAL